MRAVLAGAAAAALGCSAPASSRPVPRAELVCAAATVGGAGAELLVARRAPEPVALLPEPGGDAVVDGFLVPAPALWAPGEAPQALEGQRRGRWYGREQPWVHVRRDPAGVVVVIAHRGDDAALAGCRGALATAGSLQQRAARDEAALWQQELERADRRLAEARTAEAALVADGDPEAQLEVVAQRLAALSDADEAGRSALARQALALESRRVEVAQARRAVATAAAQRQAIAARARQADVGLAVVRGCALAACPR